MLKRPRTPPANSGVVDYPNPDHEQLMKRLRPAQSVEEVTVTLFYFCYCFTNANMGMFFQDFCGHSNFFYFQVTYPTPRQQASWSLDDLPTKVALTMHQSSTVTSMDFHPSHHTTLLGVKIGLLPLDLVAIMIVMLFAIRYIIFLIF